MTTVDATHAPPTTPIADFLTARFAGQSGWLCLGWIAGDPQAEPLRETWYELPHQLTPAIHCGQTLAACGHNLYVAPCLFRERRRSYATALASAWLWLDDVALDGAELVESSEDNYQSWLPLDQPLDARERSALQRALRNTIEGADTCSADGVHMTRLPGGWNCKHDARWQVRIARRAGAPLCVDELRERFPCMQPSALENVSAGDWSSLPSGDTLAVSPRFQTLMQANEQLGQLLAELPIGLDCHGYHDDSRSARRAIFVCQLLRAHYPHDEIRALASHFADLLDSGRGQAHFRSDVDRLLTKYTPESYAPQATRTSRTAADRAPLRRGRPITLTAEALLQFYHHYADCGWRGIVLDWTRAEIAQKMGVSDATVQRRERELIAAGTIRRQLSDDCQRSFVILSPTTWGVYAQDAETRSAETLMPEAGLDVPCLTAASNAATSAAPPPLPVPAS
jgi:hypothetical protein